MEAPRNIAYIDAANLDKAFSDSLGWKLDYRRFRVWLSDKYKVDIAYLFIGFIPKYKDLYAYFERCGFTMIYKDVLYTGAGRIKGNCDTDLILQAIKDYYSGFLNKAILVSSDGDYAPLVKELLSGDKLVAIVSPAKAEKCSILLKRTQAKIAYLDEQRSLLERHK